jgi:hypothetical protein
MELGVHLPLADLGEGLPSGRELRTYASAAVELGFTAVAANDHLVWRTPWLDARRADWSADKGARSPELGGRRGRGLALSPQTPADRRTPSHRACRTPTTVCVKCADPAHNLATVRTGIEPIVVTRCRESVPKAVRGVGRGAANRTR